MFNSCRNYANIFEIPYIFQKLYRQPLHKKQPLCTHNVIDEDVLFTTKRTFCVLFLFVFWYDYVCLARDDDDETEATGTAGFRHVTFARGHPTVTDESE